MLRSLILDVLANNLFHVGGGCPAATSTSVLRFARFFTSGIATTIVSSCASFSSQRGLMFNRTDKPHCIESILETSKLTGGQNILKWEFEVSEMCYEISNGNLENVDVANEKSKPCAATLRSLTPWPINVAKFCS